MTEVQTLPIPHMGSIQRIPSSPAVLSALEEKILVGVYKLPYLRIDQLTRYLNLSPNSLEWIRKKVNGLIARDYLDTQPLPRLTSYGVLPHLYILGTQGINFFHDKEFPVSYHSPKERLRSYGHLVHAGRVSEVLLAAHTLSRFVPAIELTSFHHDVRIKHTPCKVLVDNKPVRLHPDAVLDWYVSYPYGSVGADRFTAFLELDNDEEDINQLTPKVAKYVSFLERAFVHNPFGFDTVNAIVFLAASGGARRVKQLRTWITKELERLGKQVFAPLFKIASVAMLNTCLSPYVFVSPVFYCLGADSPTALIEKL